MSPLALPAMLATLACVLALAVRDPKRLRNLRDPTAPKAYTPPMRRLLAATALLPGAMLAVLGEGIAFLVWLGAVCTGGWIWAQVLARSRAQAD